VGAGPKTGFSGGGTGSVARGEIGAAALRVANKEARTAGLIGGDGMHGGTGGAGRHGAGNGRAGKGRGGRHGGGRSGAGRHGSGRHGGGNGHPHGMASTLVCLKNRIIILFLLNIM